MAITAKTGARITIPIAATTTSSRRFVAMRQEAAVVRSAPEYSLIGVTVALRAAPILLGPPRPPPSLDRAEALARPRNICRQLESTESGPEAGDANKSSGGAVGSERNCQLLLPRDGR